MSGEQLAPRKHIKTDEDFTRADVNPKPFFKSTNRVDINDLMSKVRDEKRKQRKENLVFFGIVSSIIVITGIIASL
tara:strand:- start:4966 stop:5193 length:228 start_codon:yes stop_codon:yes gene_type:complete